MNASSRPPIEPLECEQRRHVSPVSSMAPSVPTAQAPSPSVETSTTPTPPRLLDRVRHALRLRHCSRRTEEAYVLWIRRYIVFHGKRHPSEMGSAEVTAFLSDQAVRRQVSVSTQNQAFSALLFLYRQVLRQQVSGLDEIVRAKPSVRVPLVLSRDEVAAVLGHMRGTTGLMASLLYGSGMRLLECARLRVKDLDFDRREITIHDGKGRKDRITLLPSPLIEPLQQHLHRIQAQHAEDLKAGRGTVQLPGRLRAKYSSAESEWAWQWAFPAARFYTCAVTGQQRRHHLHESALQRAFKEALRQARIAKPASCHTLRHCAGSGITATALPRNSWSRV